VFCVTLKKLKSTYAKNKEKNTSVVFNIRITKILVKLFSNYSFSIFLFLFFSKLSQIDLNAFRINSGDAARYIKWRTFNFLHLYVPHSAMQSFSSSFCQSFITIPMLTTSPELVDSICMFYELNGTIKFACIDTTGFHISTIGKKV